MPAASVKLIIDDGCVGGGGGGGGDGISLALSDWRARGNQLTKTVPTGARSIKLRTDTSDAIGRLLAEARSYIAVASVAYIQDKQRASRRDYNLSDIELSSESPKNKW